MKKKTAPVKLGFWAWVHKNRLKIVALSFIVLVPLALLASVYIGSFTNNRKIYFDAVKTNETVIISKYRKVNPENLSLNSQFYYEIEDVNKDFDLFIMWDQLHNPYLNTESGNLDFGSYRFRMYYTPNSSKTINQMNVTTLLQTDWTDIRQIGSTTALLQTIPGSNNILIPFNYRLPKEPLPLVKVESPHLYLRIVYQVLENSNPVDKTVYLQFDLSKANPRQVFPIT